MERLPGRAASYWIESAPAPEFSTAPEDVRADVAVIGGGIAGTVTISTPRSPPSCEGPWTAGTCSSARRLEPPC